MSTAHTPDFYAKRAAAWANDGMTPFNTPPQTDLVPAETLVEKVPGVSLRIHYLYPRGASSALEQTVIDALYSEFQVKVPGAVGLYVAQARIVGNAGWTLMGVGKG